MGILKNIKEKAASQLSDNVKKIIDTNILSDNLGNIKEMISGKIDKLSKDWPEVLNQVLKGDFTFFTNEFSTNSIQTQNNVESSDTFFKVPKQDKVEKHLKKNGFIPQNYNDIFYGVKEHQTNNGSTIFNELISFISSKQGVIIIGSVAWDYDINDENKKILIDNFKYYFGNQFVIDSPADKTVLAKILVDPASLKDKNKVLSILNVIFKNLSDVSNGLYDFLKPRVQEVEEEQKRRRIKEEQEIKARTAAAEREEALSKGYRQTLDPDITIWKVQKNFNEDYPYLRLGFFLVQTGQKADKEGGTISHIDSYTELGKIRSFKGECKIRIGASDTPEELEKKFRKESGLVIKVCYNDENDKRYYISKDNKNYKKALYDINSEFKKKGYKLADIS